MRSSTKSAVATALATFASLGYVSAVAFTRLGTCPQLGCIFPPDQASFIAGQAFDIRLEIHAPINGSERYNNGVPDDNFQFSIAKEDGKAKGAAEFFDIKETSLEHWNFTYFEDLFAQDADTPVIVNVAAKAYRHVAIYEPGQYTATLKYFDGSVTTAHWTVKEPSNKRKAKNVILFVGDGMTQAMITASRLIAHKSINGIYQSLMQLDQMDALGLQMTHSTDSFITDSANSATALNTGHKSTVNALNNYVDSSPDPFDDPKFETVAEMARRILGAKIGIVSTAYLADATPAAVVTHTRLRARYQQIVDQFFNGVTNSTWYPWDGPDVLLGGGAENFMGNQSYQGNNYYDIARSRDYSVVHDKDQLDGADDSKRLLGTFSISNMAKWLDRNVYPENVAGNGDSPLLDGSDATNQPGLKQMTLKAINVLTERSKAAGEPGYFLMSEAASIDKMMHVLDMDRALGELLELDDTVRATLAKIKELGQENDTIVIVTADHGHGFDVFGSADTQYIAQADGDRMKRRAIGVYEQSGLSEYQVAAGQRRDNHSVVFGDQGPNFPVQWDGRYALANGFGANPDHRDNYTVRTEGPRVPADEIEGLDGPNDGAYVNPEDGINGFVVNGTLPVDEPQGVHSLTDVPVFATGPGSEVFRGVYNSIDIAFKIAELMDLGRTKNVTYSGK